MAQRTRPQPEPAPGRHGPRVSLDPPAPARADPAPDPRTNRPAQPPPGQCCTRWTATRRRRRPVPSTPHPRTRRRAPYALARQRQPLRHRRPQLPYHPRPQPPHPHGADTPLVVSGTDAAQLAGRPMDDPPAAPAGPALYLWFRTGCDAWACRLVPFRSPGSGSPRRRPSVAPARPRWSACAVAALAAAPAAAAPAAAATRASAN